MGLLGPLAELLLHPLPGLDVVGVTVDFVQRVEQLLCHGRAAPSEKEAGQHEGENSAFHRRVGFSQAFEYIVKSERKAFCPFAVHISLMKYAIKVAKSCRFSMFAGLFFSSRSLASGYDKRALCQNKAGPRKKQIGPKNNSAPRRFFSVGRQIR